MKKLLFSLQILLFSSALLTISKAGNTVLYALTPKGGAYNDGAIISFTPATGAESVLWSFGSGTDGAGPTGSLTYNANNGLFYGTTQVGGTYNQGGTLFTFDPVTNLEHKVWNFGNGSDGAGPGADLTYDAGNGLYYGQTITGGTVAGVIFSFNPTNNSEAVIYDFDGSISGDGSTDFYYDASQGILIAPGTGGQYFDGDLFSIDPSTQTISDLWDFGNGTDGSGLWGFGSVAYDASNGLFYINTSRGGANNKGAIISFNLSTLTENVVYSFTGGTDANYVNESLAYDASNGLFYGTSFSGGANNLGTIFSFNPTTNAESVVHSFAGGADGANPFGGIPVYDAANGLFYIMTNIGGTNNTGTIVSFNPTNNAENVVWSFGTGTDGNSPQGSFAQLPSPTGISTIATNALSVAVYPNPAQDHLTIQLKNSEVGDNYEFRIIDITGRELANNNYTVNNDTQTIDISSLTPGIYFLVLSNQQGRLTTQKFIKE